MKRSTEAVLRNEVIAAEKILERAAERQEAARLRVVDVTAAKKAADLERDDARARLDRAQAALKAFLPPAEPEAEETP